MDVKPVEKWRPFIQPALTSKQNEFKLFGYKEVTEDEIWDCLMAKVWKGNPKKHLYEVIQDIFRLPASTYMHFIQMGALGAGESDLLASIQALSKS